MRVSRRGVEYDGIPSAIVPGAMHIPDKQPAGLANQGRGTQVIYVDGVPYASVWLLPSDDEATHTCVSGTPSSLTYLAPSAPNISTFNRNYPGAAGDENNTQWEIAAPSNMAYPATDGDVLVRLHILIPTALDPSPPIGGIELFPIGFSIVGLGGVPAAGSIGGPVGVLRAGTITSVRVLSRSSGSISLDIWRRAEGATPPGLADSICGGNYPGLSSASFYEDTTLAGWTVDFAEGDQFSCYIRSASVLTNATVELTCSPA